MSRRSIHRAYDHPIPSEITPRALAESRREWLRHVALGAAGAGLAAWAARDALAQSAAVARPGKLAALAATPSTVPGAMTTEKLTDYKDASTYNNYYEFGTDKADPARNAGTLKPSPWAIEIEGMVKKPGKIGLEELLKLAPMEQRIYRLRCVEGWSMVVPWLGIPLHKILPRFQPTASAKYVEFTTLLDPAQMPGQRTRLLNWPYVEGLRMDEAMHPLTLLATGLYGKELPTQNGAPLRLVVPWKYGFKSIKSIVKIRFTEQPPRTTWASESPSEYGFYANVNPEVDHPRWSQKREQRIGDLQRRNTLLFNGYAEQVASLYAGMDLRTHF